ncbi:hypothetical protein BG015_008496 [Linnemannia schmuckeri]|uniref:J domain-containing protein n=1 Tax=Linnemannia schmuckeri TaxID=64567 RepID=A0A9P5VFK9_9FUNG|nr:hypothetical protein BG015_008496 [Linnemannia schmuckeri]
MRWNLALLMALAILALIQTVAAWEEGDFEIFDLVDALEKAEGPEVNFYSYIGVTQKTPKPEIERAFRKKSRTLHPDKNKGPKAQEKYARLSSIISILRDDGKRDRYNFFLKNGVPRWRGSAYLYRRHRPGFKSVVVFLFILASGFQYLARYVGYVQERKRMSGMIEQYKEMVREKQQKILEGPITGRQRRSNGNLTPEAVTPLEEAEGPMYAVNQYGEEIELTLDNIHPPKAKDLIIARLPFWAVKLALLPCPQSVKDSVYAMSIFESIRPEGDKAEADANMRKIRKAELAKKRAAKRAAQQKQSPSVSDDEDIAYGSEDDDEAVLAARAKEEELAAARRRRRMKAPGQASLKGGRRG